MKKIISLGLLLLITISCSSIKNSVTESDIANLKNVVFQKRFTIISQNATPLALNSNLGFLLPPGSNSGLINLANINNHFKMVNDSVSIDLPYYGERQIVSAYNTNNTGFEIDTKFNEVKTTFDGKKNASNLTFWVKTKDESLRILITLFANKSATITINSTHRTTISYRGYWENIDSNLASSK